MATAGGTAPLIAPELNDEGDNGWLDDWGGLFAEEDGGNEDESGDDMLYEGGELCGLCGDAMCLPGAGGGFIEGSLKPEDSVWDVELKYIGGNRSLVDGLAGECRRASPGWP